VTSLAASSTDQTARLARAVSYLRVSTKEQAHRGGEAEGFSIPAQRESCSRKAAALSAEVVAEFSDLGESAKSSQRPGLQDMLRYVRDNGIQYVIVHKVDRLARNRADDVQINLALQHAGAALVSCTENIDETPSGALLHGIMSSIAEFYSRNLANEVLKGSIEKAKSGGTVGKAPTGYLNVRRLINGREVRTVEVDPQRGPLMKWALEQYATGEWSVRNLLDAVTEKGLTSSGGPQTPPKPLAVSNFNRLLRTPYYCGIVTYRGVEYEGSHERLISRETFNQIQSVLSGHALSGEKRRIHNHYLKGSVVCGKCGARLGVMNSKNRWGTIYPYFYCLGRARKGSTCTQRAVLISEVEQRVIDLYGTYELPAEDRAMLRQFVDSELMQQETERTGERVRQQLRANQLLEERQKLLQAHYAGAIPMELLRSEQARISIELEAAHRLLAGAAAHVALLVAAIDATLCRLDDCHRTYEEAGPKQRREMNQAVFRRIEVSDDDTIVGELTEAYSLLLHKDVRDAATAATQSDSAARLRTRHRAATKNRTPAFAGRGSSIDWLVGEGGLEPPHPFEYWHLKPARLPFRHSPEWSRQASKSQPSAQPRHCASEPRDRFA
jgi:site-specific DNA recombinase